MATAVARNINQSVTESVLIRDVSEDMVLLEPDTTPLLVLTNQAKRKRPSISPRFEWVEDQEVAFWAQVNEGSDKSAAATTVTVTDGSLFLPGDLAAVPKANSSSAVEEVVLVSGVATNVLTISRGIGGSGADTISASGSIRIIGSAMLENDTLPTGRYTTKVTQISYCQIFRTVVDISETQRSTQVYGSPDGEEKFQWAKALIRHKAEIEAAGLWSRPSETLASPNSRWTTMGLKARIATFVTDMSTTITLSKFNDFSATAFRYGKPSKLFIAAPKVISALNYWSQNRLFTTNDDVTFGVTLQKFRLPHGELMLARNFRMEAGISGQNGYDDEAYVIDLPSVGYRYLNGNGKSRDTKLFQNVVVNGVDGQKSEYKSQVGWEFRHEKRHARLFDVSAYA